MEEGKEEEGDFPLPHQPLSPSGQRPAPPTLMLEHLAKAEDYAGARAHVFAVGKQNGLAFE